MQNSVENYKNLFFHHLKPFLDMLDYQQGTMDSREWEATVYRIASSVDSHPEQYLGKDLPDHETTSQFIKEIFEEFIGVHSLITEEV